MRAEPPASAQLPSPRFQHGVRGLLVWLAAAASLVAGIVIGFVAGYSSGQRNAPANAAQAFSEAAVSDVSADSSAEALAAGSSAKAEPTRVEEPIVVPEPEPPPAINRSDRSDRSSRADRSTLPNVSNASNGSNASNESGPGSIDVISRPSGAQVILDGRFVGRTPLSVPNVTAGAHSIRLELAGHTRWSNPSVQVNPGARTRVAASLEQQ